MWGGWGAGCELGVCVLCVCVKASGASCVWTVLTVGCPQAANLQQIGRFCPIRERLIATTVNRASVCDWTDFCSPPLNPTVYNLLRYIKHFVV